LVTNVTGDDRPDLIICNGSGFKYYENKGGNPAVWQKRSAGLPTSGSFTAVNVADLNKDGLNDIVTTDYSGNEHFYVQNSTGTLWTDYSSTLNSPDICLGIAFGDVNNDTHTDVIFGLRTNGLRCYLGNSGGAMGTTFVWTAANSGLPGGGGHFTIQAVDIDYDGDIDVIAPRRFGGGGIHIYLGNGNTNPGTAMSWTEATGTNLSSTGDWFGAHCVDINKDGSLDIIGVSWGSSIKAWLSSISLDVTAPDSIIDLAVTNITTTTITVNWTAPADNATNASSGPVKAYDIRYSTSVLNAGSWSAAVECIGEPVPAAPGTPESFVLTGLLPGTHYYIALKARDERPNWTPLSNVVQGTTLGLPDTTIPGAITDLAAVAPTNNSINLTWTAPADNGTNASSGPVTGYEIKYHSALLTNATWPSGIVCTDPITPGAPGTTEQYTVTGLQAETTYYFAVKPYDERSNLGWLSNSAFNTTLPDPDLVPPALITDLNAVEPTNNSINLTWTSVGDDGGNGTASVYDIRYDTVSISELNWHTTVQCQALMVPKAAGTPESYQVTDLSPETTYYFALKVGDETPLWSPLSNVAFNMTLPDPDIIPPEAVIDLNAGSPTDTTITLTWTAPGNDSDQGTAAEYDIRYASSEITRFTWDNAQAASGPPAPKPAGEPETFVVQGLTPDTTYYFAIKSRDKRPNWSPLSNSPHATTLKVTDVQDMGVILTPDKTELYSKETINIEVGVYTIMDPTPVEGANITLLADHSGVNILPDTGLSGSDGKLIVQVTAPDVTSLTNVTIEVGASKTGFRFNRTELVLTVNPVDITIQFNLRITDSDLFSTPDNITEGTEVTFNAVVTNTGPNDATGFGLLFFVDGSSIGKGIAYEKLSADGTIKAQRKWIADTAGTHIVRVEIISAEPLLETDLFDNVAQVSFHVNEKSTVDDTDTGPGPDTGKKEIKDSEGFSGGSWLLFIAVIVVIIIAVFVLIQKRQTKKQEPELLQPLPPPPPPPPQELPAEPEPPVQAAEEAVQVPEEPQGVGLPVTEQPSELPPPAPPAEPAEPPVEDHVDTVEEPTTEPEPEQPTETSQQPVPCPGCSNLITPYSSPCPHCGMNLNWS
jgi:hypothetical protein